METQQIEMALAKIAETNTRLALANPFLKLANEVVETATLLAEVGKTKESEDLIVVATQLITIANDFLGVED